MNCCDITPGSLRQRITIQRETATPDGFGGNIVTFVDLASVRAFVNPVSGKERVFSLRIEAETTHRIYIRYRADLTTTDRILFKGRTMQIRALINLEEADKFIEIYADEGVAT